MVVLGKKLLVLDVNGLLVDTYFQGETRPDRPHDVKVNKFYVYKRPSCDEFVKFCLENFIVGVWSSARVHNVHSLVDYIFNEAKGKLAFIWHQRHCTDTGIPHPGNKYKPVFLKELQRLWEKYDPDLPWDIGDYGPSNTLLIDDSAYKAINNPPHTAIFPKTYKASDLEDTYLDGELRIYLEGIVQTTDVQVYLQENPIGEPSIAIGDPQWSHILNLVTARNGGKLQVPGDTVHESNLSADLSRRAGSIPVELQQSQVHRDSSFGPMFLPSSEGLGRWPETSNLAQTQLHPIHTDPAEGLQHKTWILSQSAHHLSDGRENLISQGPYGQLENQQHHHDVNQQRTGFESRSRSFIRQVPYGQLEPPHHPNVVTQERNGFEMGSRNFIGQGPYDQLERPLHQHVSHLRTSFESGSRNLNDLVPYGQLEHPHHHVFTRQRIGFENDNRSLTSQGPHGEFEHPQHQHAGTQQISGFESGSRLLVGQGPHGQLEHPQHQHGGIQHRSGFESGSRSLNGQVPYGQLEHPQHQHVDQQRSGLESRSRGLTGECIYVEREHPQQHLLTQQESAYGSRGRSLPGQLAYVGWENSHHIVSGERSDYKSGSRTITGHDIYHQRDYPQHQFLVTEQIIDHESGIRTFNGQAAHALPEKPHQYVVCQDIKDSARWQPHLPENLVLSLPRRSNEPGLDYPSKKPGDSNGEKSRTPNEVYGRKKTREYSMERGRSAELHDPGRGQSRDSSRGGARDGENPYRGEHTRKGLSSEQVQRNRERSRDWARVGAKDWDNINHGEVIRKGVSVERFNHSTDRSRDPIRGGARDYENTHRVEDTRRGWSSEGVNHNSERSRDSMRGGARDWENPNHNEGSRRGLSQEQFNHFRERPRDSIRGWTGDGENTHRGKDSRSGRSVERDYYSRGRSRDSRGRVRDPEDSHPDEGPRRYLPIESKRHRFMESNRDGFREMELGMDKHDNVVNRRREPGRVAEYDDPSSGRPWLPRRQVNREESRGVGDTREGKYFGRHPDRGYSSNHDMCEDSIKGGEHRGQTRSSQKCDYGNRSRGNRRNEVTRSDRGARYRESNRYG